MPFFGNRPTEIGSIMESALNVHPKREGHFLGNKLAGLNRKFANIHYLVKKYKRKHHDRRQRRHYMRYKLTIYEEVVPLLALDYMKSAKEVGGDDPGLRDLSKQKLG